MNGHGGPLVFVSTHNLWCVYNWAGFKTKNTLFQAQGVRATKKAHTSTYLFLQALWKSSLFEEKCSGVIRHASMWCFVEITVGFVCYSRIPKYNCYWLCHYRDWVKLPNCHKKLNQGVCNKADVLAWPKRLEDYYLKLLQASITHICLRENVRQAYLWQPLLKIIWVVDFHCGPALKTVRGPLDHWSVHRDKKLWVISMGFMTCNIAQMDSPVSSKCPMSNKPVSGFNHFSSAKQSPALQKHFYTLVNGTKSLSPEILSSAYTLLPLPHSSLPSLLSISHREGIGGVVD